ncbi:MAG: hypothetical protein KIT84_33725 [Labilithrix sp.]|nr:hypothetical protein [Labilithrix sp.]MCW5816008.1 hypothetical protein [Labilithrix sp.]
MTSFVERAIERAGLGGVLPARRRGDLDAVRAEVASAGVDLLVLGALADAIRADECGDVVRVHPVAAADVLWIAREGKSELDLLRAVAVARITSPRGQRIGLDWGTSGLEVPQVALGFGATDLTGPITKKSGDLIDESELKKVKGQGMVAKTALRRLEIAALLHNAGRVCQFTDETAPTAAPKRIEEAAHV